ncbi:MAG TPA: LemA family protein [Gemmatimonadales bacterium]|nr:LemA family protein [Gemmatimonadales bacterium]
MPRAMPTLRFLRTAAAILVVGTTASGCGYNQIQTLDEQTNNAKGQIQTQLQRRNDLIPNLVATVKGVAKQESTVFGNIADARAKMAGAIQSGNVDSMGAANAQLTAGLGRLIAISENYPELRSSESFRQLQDQLEGTENRIAVARNDYNSSVNQYNAYIRRFPTNLTAKVFGYGTKSYFQAEAGAQGVPTVKF